MKASWQVAAILLGIFAPSFLSSQRIAPCLCIPNDPAWASGTAETQKCTSLTALSPTTAATPLQNKVVLEVKDDPSDLDKYHDARYKAFWMWGDGNYTYFDHGDKVADLLTYKQEYTYSKTGRFIPVVILTEKKSDKAPPGRMERQVQINQIGGSPSAFVQRLNVSGKTADIFSTEDLRAGGFHTAMVVSAPADFDNRGVFFFYNSIYDKKKNAYSAAPVHQKLSVEVPAYATDAGLTLQGGETKDIKNTSVIQFIPNATLLNALSKGFQSYFFLEMNATALRNMSAGFNEYRFFPVLQTIWPDTLTEADFLALVVGSSAPSTFNDNTPDDFYDAKRIVGMQSTLSGLAANYDTLGVLSGLSENFLIGTATDQAGNSSNIFVRGIARESAKLVGSIDPNELEVKKICPTDNGRYKVTMRLQICNEGYMFENSITVRLLDAGNHFSRIDIPQTIKAEFDNTFREDTISPLHLWSFVWGRHLEGIYDTVGTTIEYNPSCAEFDFTIETDWAGVQKLQAGQGLEMCVTFSNSIPPKEICGFFNFPIRGAVTQAGGYACGDDCQCNWLCWLLIIVGVILLLLLLWWWYKKQQNNNTP